MVEITFDMNHLVISAITIDDETLVPRHFAGEARPIELIPKSQLRGPFEDKEDGVGQFHIKRELERWQRTRTTIKNHLMPEFAGCSDVVVNILCAAGIFGDEVHEHDFHRLFSRAAQLAFNYFDQPAQPRNVRVFLCQVFTDSLDNVAIAFWILNDV